MQANNQKAAVEYSLESGDDEINQEDAWAVIRSYFKQHGLVS